MTELETRLTDALKALSTQWDADQQQHVEELDILCARIDDLAQTGDRLRGAARATRRGPWSTTRPSGRRSSSSSARRWGILTEQYAHITADYKTLAALLAQV